MHPSVVTATFLFLITTDGQYAAAVGGCIPRERDALLAFKRGVTDDPSGLLSSWQHDDCCGWRGVRCSNLTGHVLKLQLADTGMTGLISRSLLSLERLLHLDLSWSYLAGPTGRMPEFLGSFKSLVYLNLSGVPFAGAVPPQLGNLSKLQYLDLSNMYDVIGDDLQGTMHSTDMSWLTHLPFLRHLILDWINLTAVDDWPRFVNTLPSLSFLSLSSCSLTSANQSLLHPNLTNLEKLDLSMNLFHQPVASCWFWNLTSLRELVLSGNLFYGQVPNSLGDMTSLQVLDVSYNCAVPSDSSDEDGCKRGISIMAADLRNLCSLEILDLTQSLASGNITELLESLSQCASSKLEILHLGNNNLSGILTDSMGKLSSLVSLDLSLNHITAILPNSLGKLASLVYLDLSVNYLTGTLPNSMGKLSRLVTVNLSKNNFTGHVPSEIGMLTNLTKLDLSYNHLDCSITEKHFAHLTSLKKIDLSANFLKIVVAPQWLPPFRLEYASFYSCQMGPLFPTWLQSQVDIIDLDISNTNIKDTIPDRFWTTFSKAKFLCLSSNQIVGRLPTNMENMSLVSLYLDSNQISGQIPRLPRNLTDLDISKNSLSGPLPSNFGAPNLNQLNLYSNHMNGHIPKSIGELSLENLDLGNNLLEGEVPQSFQTISMKFLRLSNNSLYGKFPSFLRDCTLLNFLDLSSNKFSGKLPTWIGNLTELRVLRLRDNKFCGNIPDSITKLENLHHLDLAGNSLSGSLPRNLSKIMAMKRNETLISVWKGITYNYIVTMKRQELFYDEKNVEVVTIDMSSNCLIGEIPEEIVSLVELVNLNLSWNYLSGIIPDKIGVLLSLQSLDLSHNKLSKAIPSSLSKLTYLSYLDLSYNNLTGRIPSGSQLYTLYAQHPYMYNGNTGLCGPPLQKNCPSDGISPPPPGHLGRTGQDFQPVSFYFGLVLGFIAGLWVLFCTLLFAKAWRIAYFHLVDMMYDETYVFVVVTCTRWTQKTNVT